MSIKLKPHNVETYKKVTDKLKESNKVAVIHPTGTGKMYIALKLLEANKEKKAIYVAPSNPILHDVKKNIFAEGMTMSEFPNLKRITYQKLARLTDEEIQELDADIIVLDEFHHCGAPEWGKGVDRLLKRNEGASVLGLSATPLRYTDGLRDMTDELFENSVAAEMTLEEAIESEILPEASYVSTLYGYDKTLKDMQTNIDKIKDEDKREEAQKLLESLRGKLDENTQNLPELFSEHMKNKTGKYIVFCRNIEDMNEKMEQAQKMFWRVNPNMTIRGVSSKIKESDKILTEFEQDSEEGTLKLLYAVDMLNEGYHIRDLDGVVMMRPTFSPTIYTQQLGRALTVGGDKSPVVLDLVNNFDSCKIIEDFAERMKKYKGNDKIGRTESSKKSRFSIVDTTKEFREIAEKITELSKRNKVKLEQKIEIFEEFMKTGEELVSNTTFEGYPIGQWAIQIRSSLKRMNEGKDDEISIKPTKDQLEKLESMGILERKIDSTIDEKIDTLVEWRRKYPKIKIIPIATDEELREYAKTDEEFKQIQEEYKRIQRYYDYAKYRKYQGKLNEEQIQKCKNGRVGGVFGHPIEIEELSKKYRIKEKDIDYILTKYGTLDNFYEMHKKGAIKGEKDKELEAIIIKDTIDVDQNSNRGYDDLWSALEMNYMGYNFYSSEELKRLIDEKLTENEKYVLEKRFGLVDGTIPKNLENVGEELSKTRERIRQIEKHAIRKLKKPAITRKIARFTLCYNPEFTTSAEREQVERIKKDIQLQNGDLSKNLARLRKIEKKIEEKQKIGTYLEGDEIKIENLELSIRTFNGLKRAGINSLSDLANVTEKQFMEFRNMGKSSLEEIIIKMQQHGICFREDNEQRGKQDGSKVQNANDEQQRKQKCSKEQTANDEQNKKTGSYSEGNEIKIENLELSIRTFNGLKRAGINSLSDLANVTEKQFRKFKNIGKVGFEEIVNKMQQYGIYFREDGEQQGKQNDSKEQTANDEQKKKEMNFENMTIEELQNAVQQNDKTIKDNNKAIKQRLVKRLLEQQRIIEEQQAEIEGLSNQKGVIE